MLKNNYWAHKTAEIQEGAKIGAGTKIWHNCQILSGAIIGKNCTIGHNCFIDSKVKLGNNVKLESNIDIWSLVSLEDYVFVGPSAVFTNDLTPRAKYPKDKFPEYGQWLSTLVKEGATIGANATIICGNNIGRQALVGAGSVVTKNIPDYALVLGMPAKIVGWVCECGNKIKFGSSQKTVCKICKREYEKENQIIKLSSVI